MKLSPFIPDFLIIGAGKSGTTSLDKYLKQHPQIFIPSVKEPNFFGYENVKIEDLEKDNPGEVSQFLNSIKYLEEYLGLFKQAKPSQIIGETSNLYLKSEHAPGRIHHYNPKMKLIAILRQPVDRLYSRFLHLAREGALPTKSFESCLDPNTIWWHRNDLIPEGYYYQNLSKYYSLFPKENIRVFLFEDFSYEPREVLKNIYKFLEVDPKFEADLTIKYNQSGFIKNKFTNSIYGQQGLLINTVKQILPKAIVNELKDSLLLRRGINSLRNRNLVRPKLDPSVKESLIQKVYLEDINKLASLIDRDLSKWLIA